MTGLLYKELRQNKMGLILCAAAPVGIFLAMMVLPFADYLAGDTSLAESFRSVTGRDPENGPSWNLLLLLPIFYTLMVSGVAQMSSFTQDETKKWGYFTASHPKGYCIAVYYKYVVIFLMQVLTMVSLEMTQMLFYFVEHLVLGTTPSDMSGSYSFIFMMVVFVQMFIRMFDLPFMFRYGAKRGSNAKATAIAVLLFAGFVYLLYGPLPESFDVIAERFSDLWDQFQAGKANDWLYYGLAAFFWMTIIGTYVSYKISCKMYMKGVEQYDK